MVGAVQALHGCICAPRAQAECESEYVLQGTGRAARLMWGISWASGPAVQLVAAIPASVSHGSGTHRYPQPVMLLAFASLLVHGHVCRHPV